MNQDKGYYHYINGRKHKFNSFKIYWAYMWYEAEEIDKRGVLGGTYTTRDKRITSTYRFKYCPINELEYYKSITKYTYKEIEYE